LAREASKKTADSHSRPEDVWLLGLIKEEQVPQEIKENSENQERSLKISDDVEFERTWWRIEIGIWIFLTAFLVIAATGLLGRGPLAKGRIASPDGQLSVQYERISRYKTPSTMIIQISPGRTRTGETSLWVNNGIVRQMGLQRVVPEPHRTEPGPDGVTYVWPIADPATTFTVRLDMQPDTAGVSDQEIRTDSAHSIGMRSVTVP